MITDVEYLVRTVIDIDRYQLPWKTQLGDVKTNRLLELLSKPSGSPWYVPVFNLAEATILFDLLETLKYIEKVKPSAISILQEKQGEYL